MTDAERERFDAVFEAALGELPDELLAYLDEAPVVLDDRPSPEMLASLNMEADDILCGLHTGIAVTEDSVEFSGVPTDVINLFREGIVSTAGGWDGPDAEEAVYNEIMVTLLHEIGHHFGLDEDDLDALGYG